MNVILIENHVYRQFEITLNNTNEVGNLKKPQSHMLCECILEHINHCSTTTKTSFKAIKLNKILFFNFG